MSTVRTSLKDAKPLTNEQRKRLKNLRDKDIDFSDIPELDESFWKNARVHIPEDAKQAISLRLDKDVLEWFKAQGKGYTTKMNAILRHYKEAHE